MGKSRERRSGRSKVKGSSLRSLVGLLVREFSFPFLPSMNAVITACLTSPRLTPFQFQRVTKPLTEFSIEIPQGEKTQVLL